jgi:hypothetical protein
VSGAVPWLQSEKPELHVYEHVRPVVQLSAEAFTALQTFPQPAQLLVELVGVVHPPRSGGEPVVQSAKPGSHVYLHVVPLQLVLLDSDVLHVSPHAVQLLVVLSAVQLPEQQLFPAPQLVLLLRLLHALVLVPGWQLWHALVGLSVPDG